MKKLTYLLQVILVVTLFSSCKNDDDQPSVEISITPFAATVAENPSVNAVIGTVSASTNVGEISYSLANQDPQGALAINASTGVITVADASAFDFETRQGIDAQVTASVGQESKSAAVSITITNVDDAVVTASDFTVTIDENPNANEVLGTIDATTTEGQLSYTIVSQTPDGAIAVGGASGEITVANAALFDFEMNESLTATVEVQSGMAKQNITVTVNLNDVTEVEPGTIPFVFTWEVAAGESIRLPRRSGLTYEYTVDWGDGTTHVEDASVAIQNAPHTYTNAGVYTVSITGSFPSAPFDSSQLSDAFRTIEQWGNGEWENMNRMFSGISNFGYSATDTPDLSKVTDMSFMFESTSIGNVDLSGWNTSNVTNMDAVFRRSTFSGNISTWDVSNVTTMRNMFETVADFNSDISGWDVGNVTDMYNMFGQARSFNQDISGWNVSQVSNMESMFNGATIFNQNINGWNVSNVMSMIAMFRNAAAFNSDLNSWDVSNVTNMANMFAGATNFNGNVSSWDVSNVTNMNSMFSTGGGISAKGKTSASKFNQDISGWNVANVTTMGSMFAFNADFNQDISSWNVQNVTNMSTMFQEATSFNQNIGGWNVASLDTMFAMFNKAAAFNQDISSWDVSKVTNFANIFNGAISFNQDVSSWNVENATNMVFMFRDATSFNQNVSNWNVSNVQSFNGMFQDASSFNQDVSNWQFVSVQTTTSLRDMFSNSGLNSANYDTLLNSFANQANNIPANMVFNGTGLVYCAAGTAARNTLITTYNWTFTDSICSN